MAQRRMFSKDIVCSDAFLEMPISSQLLYFQLGMEADDDGFIGSPKKIARMVNSNDDDLKVLASKRFVLVFPNGIIVIKHWKINNYIQSDRYKETRYLEEKSQLTTKENGSYTECIQNGNTGKVRLGKVSIGKDIKMPNGIVSLEDLKYEPLEGKTLKNYRNARRQAAGKEPIKSTATQKQKEFIKRMKGLDYFHKLGVENGYEYLKEQDDQANRKFMGLARAFEKRYPENWKEVIDWWFMEDNSWCDYHPSNFFSIATWMKFDNRKVIPKDKEPTNWAGDLPLYGNEDIQEKLNKGIIKFNQLKKIYEQV